ncbi:hypothetical protein CCP2SC5_1020002 [Azospirillaceae bacterium]
MSDDIKARIERLIGDGPEGSFSVYGDDDTYKAVQTMALGWIKWRESLIDRLANSAEIMTGQNGDAFGVVPSYTFDTHSALVLDIQPISRGVSKDEIVKLLKSGKDAWPTEMFTLADRIEKFGVCE